MRVLAVCRTTDIWPTGTIPFPHYCPAVGPKPPNQLPSTRNTDVNGTLRYVSTKNNVRQQCQQWRVLPCSNIALKKNWFFRVKYVNTDNSQDRADPCRLITHHWIRKACFGELRNLATGQRYSEKFAAVIVALRIICHRAGPTVGSFCTQLDMVRADLLWSAHNYRVTVQTVQIFSKDERSAVGHRQWIDASHENASVDREECRDQQSLADSR